jgi:hypothetical protein
MGRLSDDLQEMGFTTTGEESPIDENGTVYRKGIEAVCDETGVVIDGNHFQEENDNSNERHEYRNSGKVKLFGAYLGNFDWGDDGDRFRY